MIQKVIDLKDKIEKEINNINILYEKTINDLTKSYELKHEKLLKEENDIKERLQNEVTKIKEKLENFWSLSNSEIRINEKINQGIKKLKNEEKNVNQILSYVSTINKNQKEINKLLQENIKSIKFNYDEKESDIKFDEYYFSGFPIIIKDIEIRNITDHSLTLFWKMEKLKNNIEDYQIKYRVEMRKNEERFIEIYKGKSLYCSTINLEYNTDYEFRICPLYNNVNGSWLNIKNIKTKDFDSIILKEEERKNEFLKKIFEWNNNKKMELIYRGSRDGMTTQNFHNKCDNKGPTITLFKTEKSIFGGFTSISWSTDEKYHFSKECFIFTLSNIYNTKPTKFPFKNDKHAVCHSKGYGPYFGNSADIGINYSDFLNNTSYSTFPRSYEDVLGKGYSIFSGDVNDNRFNLKEIEVFKVLN